MCRAARAAPFLVLLVASVASAQGLFRDDALALIQSSALGGSVQRRAIAAAAFEAGQEVEVNVFGSKWVNCTIVGPGAKLDTYKIHVPSFPEGHQDLPDVKAATLRDPRAEEKRLAKKAAEAAKVKADAEARQKADEAEKKAAEAEEHRMAELLAHTFEPGELVEVKSVGTNGTLNWVKAKIDGKGSQPNRYNISIGNTKISNINYLALRKDATYHFEVGEHVEVKSKGGNFAWVKCTITGKGDDANTYNIHIPAAPIGKRDVYNVRAMSLRKEPIPVWTPKLELGQLMEVKLITAPNKSSWVRCNVTDKAVKVETYHIQVLTNATGYRMENVSAAMLRETLEGVRLLTAKHERQKADAEARRKAEQERLRKEEEEATRKRYALRKIQEVEDEQKRIADQLKAEEEQAKTDPLMFIKVQARKKMEQMVAEKQERRKRAARALKEQEEREREMMKKMQLRAKDALEKRQNEEWQASEGGGEGEAWIKEAPKTAPSTWINFEEAERNRKVEAQKKFQAMMQRGMQEETQFQAEFEERRKAMMEARAAAEQEKQRQKREEERLRRRGDARANMQRAAKLYGDSALVRGLRPAIEDAHRNEVEAEAMVEPSRTLIWALWNTTGAKLRQVIQHHTVGELQRALLEGQAAGLEMARLRGYVRAGEAKLRGEEAPAEEGPSIQDIAVVNDAASRVSSALTRGNLVKVLARNYSAPLLAQLPEYVEAERVLRYEAGKWAAYLHMKDAEHSSDRSDLRLAVEEAQKANVTEALVKEGRVISGLLEAVEAQDIPTLQSAIAAAEDFAEFCKRSNIVSNDTAVPLGAARKVLDEETAKEPVRLNLRSAVAAGDLKSLESALRRSESAKLRESELVEARSLKAKITQEKRAEVGKQLLEEAERRRAARDAQAQARVEEMEKERAEFERRAQEAAESKMTKKQRKAAKEAQEAQDLLERKRKEADEYRERKQKEEQQWRMNQEQAEQKLKAKFEARAKAKEDAAKAKEAAAEARRLKLEEAKVAKEEAKLAKEEAKRAKEEKLRQQREAREKARQEAEQRKKEEAERREREAEERQKLAEQRRREEAERKAKEEEERRLAREEAERKEKVEAERKAEERERKKREAEEERERKAREAEEERQRKAKEAEERKAREAEEKRQAEAAQLAKERKAREDEEKRIKSEAEWRARELAMEKAKQDAARQERIEARKAAKEEEERRAKDEERRARLQEAQRAQEERERQAREERRLRVENRRKAEEAKQRAAATASLAVATPPPPQLAAQLAAHVAPAAPAQATPAPALEEEEEDVS